MALSDTVGEKLKQFERYNNSELHRMELPGGFPFAVTGRLISGAIGFAIISIILAISFQSAANSVAVSGIGGGSTGFEADVTTNETQVLSEAGELSVGQTVEQTADHTNNTHIIMFLVHFTWDSQSVADRTANEVTVDVFSDNASREPLVKNAAALHGTMDFEWVINTHPGLIGDSVSGSADDEDGFTAQFEVPGEALTVRVTYDSDNTPLINEDIDYSVTVTLVNWELQNIREISDI